MTFFYLTNFSYVKTVLTIWSVSQFAIFKNMHVFADPITCKLPTYGKPIQFLCHNSKHFRDSQSVLSLMSLILFPARQ